MSFILDALKKSETDRQQHSGAEFAGLPTHPATPSIPRWLWVVGLLLAINLAVLVSLILRPESATPLDTDGAVTRLPTVTTAPPPSFADQVARAQLDAPEKRQELAVAEPDETVPKLVRPVVISQDPSSIPAVRLYPSLQEVRASGTSSLPELHLDIHVYSTRPEDRFVFINMAKLREGSQLAEGPVVAEITPDGVVLGHQGQLFLLPRE